MNFVSVNVRYKSHPHLALQLAADTVVEKFYWVHLHRQG